MKKRSLTSLKRATWSFYEKYGRHDLPWRKTRDPYRILVSEVMLQQTQVSRVIQKYNAFLKLYPNVSRLAEAPLRDVLIVWQGLGYNRRAKFLHECAKEVVRHHGGVVPTDYEALRALPGIGPYTAGAVAVFATNSPQVLIETNVRTVFLHHLFREERDIADSTLLPYIERAVVKEEDPRSWYWALMDYGSHLKSKGVRTHRNSKHYSKQTRFKGSDREVRGAILKLLSKGNILNPAEIATQTAMNKKKVERQLHALSKEGFVHKKGNTWTL